MQGHRVNLTVPFQNCDVDYLGPLIYKDIYYSSNDEMRKAYIALFTCSTSKAVILDLVESNTNENFIISIDKFIEGRGCPKDIVSNNRKVFTSQEYQSICTAQRITW